MHECKFKTREGMKFTFKNGIHGYKQLPFHLFCKCKYREGGV